MTLFSLLSLFLLSLFSPAVCAASWWPSSRGPGGLGALSTDTPTTPGTTLLEFTLSSTHPLLSLSQAVAGHDAVFSADQGGVLVKINTTGGVAWRSDYVGRSSWAPLLLDSGFAVVGVDSPASLAALDRAGSGAVAATFALNSSFALSGAPSAGPVVEGDPTPTVFAATYDKLTLVRLNGTGFSVVWEAVTGPGSVTVGDTTTLFKSLTGSSPVLSPDAQVVYVGSMGNASMMAFNASDGSLLWSHRTDGPVVSTPALRGGLLYFGSEDGKIRAVDAATGALAWSVPTSGPVSSSPALEDIDLDGAGIVSTPLLFSSNTDGSLSALHALTGSTIWTHWSTARLGSFVSSPVVLNARTVYAGGRDGLLRALSASTGSLLWSFRAARNGFVQSPCLLPNGAILVPADKLYGFKELAALSFTPAFGSLQQPGGQTVTISGLPATLNVSVTACRVMGLFSVQAVPVQAPITPSSPPSLLSFSCDLPEAALIGSTDVPMELQTTSVASQTMPLGVFAFRTPFPSFSATFAELGSRVVAVTGALPLFPRVLDRAQDGHGSCSNVFMVLHFS